MSKGNNRGSDYILRLKLDTKTLEREYPRVYAKLMKAQARQAAAERRNARATSRANREQLTFLRQQERLAAKIAKAEQQGTKGINKYRQMSRSSNPQVLAMADIGISRANRLRAAEIAADNEKARAKKENIRKVEAAEREAHKEQARRDREAFSRGQRRSKARARAKRELAKAEAAAAKQETAQRLRQVAILRQQEALLGRIARAEQAGVGGLDRFRQMANSSRAEVLGRAQADLSRSMRNSRGIGGAEQLSVDINHSRNRAYSVGPQFQDQLQGNLGRLGEIERELSTARTTRRVRELRRAYQEVQTEIRGIERAQANYNRTVARSNSLVQRFSTSIRHMGLQMASAYAVVSGAQAAFNIGKDMDGMRAGLLAASDSAAEAGENFQFLKDMSNDLGRDLQSGTQSFNRLAIAARGAGYSTAETREIFKGISESATTSQLSIDKTNLAMLAMSQMMSKGKVSSEELSRQLAEQVPATMKAAEMATGKTTREVLDLMKAGKLLSKDFVLPFARAMSTLARANGALEVAKKKVGSEQIRARNSLVEIVDGIFQGGAGDVFSSWFRMFTKAMNYIKPTLTSFSITAVGMFDGVIQSLAAVISALDEINRMFTKTDDQIGMIGVAIRSLLLPLDGLLVSLYYVIGGFYKLMAVKDKFYASDKADKEAARLWAQQERTGIDLGAVNPAAGNKVTIGSLTVNSNKADSKEVAYEVMQQYTDMVAN